MLSNLLLSILDIINFILQAYSMVIIGRVVISWVNADPYNPIVRFIYEITEPVLGRIRRILPVSFGGIDLSPMILLLAIIFIQNFIARTIH